MPTPSILNLYRSRSSNDTTDVKFTKSNDNLKLVKWYFDLNDIVFDYGAKLKAYNYSTIFVGIFITLILLSGIFFVGGAILRAYIAPHFYTSVENKICTVYPNDEIMDIIKFYVALCGNTNITLATIKNYRYEALEMLSHVYYPYDNIPDGDYIECGTINSTSYWSATLINYCKNSFSDMLQKSGNVLFYIFCCIFGLLIIVVIAFPIFRYSIRKYVDKRDYASIRVCNPPFTE